MVMANAVDNTVKTPAAATTAAGKASANAAVNFDTFIKLLSVQLQNQDPLNPMDGTAFTEQMATFAGLEQQIATNAHLEEMAKKNDLTAQTLAVSYIGKDAMLEGDAIAKGKDGGATFAIALKEQAKIAEVQIKDATGAVVRTVSLSDKGAGVQYINWDGTDDDGVMLPEGNYKITFSAYDNEGNKVESAIYTYGRVVSVEGDSDNQIFVKLADGREALLDEVFGVKEPASSGPNASAQALALSYIGKEALISGDVVHYNGSSTAIGTYVVDDSWDYTVTIKNAEGQVIRTIKPDYNKGFNTISWDGLDDAGNAVAEGDYSVDIVAEKEEGSYINIESFTYGKVVGVEGDASNIILKYADGRQSGLYEVFGVRSI